MGRKLSNMVGFRRLRGIGKVVNSILIRRKMEIRMM